MAIFGLQVADRVMAYCDYDTNVNIKVNYPSSMTFPSVTICNLNNYR